MIRKARASDLAGIQACVEASYGHYIDELGEKPGPLLDDYRAMLKDHHVWVFEKGERILGLLILIEKETYILLDNVAVHPDIQGQGVGKQLMRLAELESEKLGYDEIQLYTHEKMLGNQARYKKLGYVEFDRRVERNLNRVYLKKDLQSKSTSFSVNK